MPNENKNSLSYKIQKNPFLIGLAIIIGIVVLFAVFSLSSAFRKKTAEVTTEVSTTAFVATTETQPETTETDSFVDLAGINIYTHGVSDISSDYSVNRVAITVKYKDKQSLLSAFGVNAASEINVTPMFVFYVNHGTVLKCPGEMYLEKDGVSVSYYLYEIDDLKNAVSLTDAQTVTYENVLRTNFFNLALMDNKTEEFTTLLGSYTIKAEEDANNNNEIAVNVIRTGVKKAEITVTEKFVWLDVYFTNDTAFKTLNYNFENNFIGFRFVSGKKNVDNLFSTTYYNDLQMIRCKVDTYTLQQLKEQTGENFTLPELFERNMTVYVSNYDASQDIFSF